MRRQTLKDNNKVKKKQELENGKSFCAVLKCSNCADREKDKSNYRSPSIVKNNGEKGMKLSKVKREKQLAQIFRQDLAEKKLERTRTRIKIMLSASPSSVSSQSLQYQFEKQIHILS